MIQGNFTNSELDLVYEDVIIFVTGSGWSKYESDNKKWLVFRNEKDKNLEGLEIVLPIEQNKNIKTYYENIVRTFSMINKVSPYNIVQDIKYFDRDVLRIRDLETDDIGSISIKTASCQIQELKKLIAYSACSESSQKPYYINSQLAIANDMIESYRFGHTFRGSFGFTIETPRISKDQFNTDISLFPEQVDNIPYIPLHRKVMERIVRGLKMTKIAEREKNSQLLIDNYKDGFNSNMCTAIVNMSMGIKKPLEYSISWSKRRPPESKEILETSPVILYENDYINLKYAADRLRTIEPMEVSIKGLIIELKSNDNPLDFDASRSVMIRWIDDEHRTYNVYVELNKKDYIEAIQAHRSWESVKIEGILERDNNSWRLTNYHDFQRIKLSI